MMVRAPVVSVIVNYITAGEKCCSVKYGYDAMTVSGVRQRHHEITIIPW